MPVGTGQLKKQIGGRGAFAVVCLDAEWVEQPVELSISPTAELYEGEHYITAVKVGVEHVWPKLLKERYRKPSHLKIEVTKILTTTVDTSVMMVVYATIMAICDALDLDPKQFVDLDLQSRRLCLDL